jgi:polygalacturonase
VISWTPRADWVNVKDLGAKGDGTSDDTAAITTALGKLTNSDYGKPLNTDVKTVYFPPGT